MRIREKISIFGLYLVVTASCAFYAELVVWGVECLVVLSDEHKFSTRGGVFVFFAYLSFRYCLPSLRKVWH